MNYRHIYHAGNNCDVFKHLVYIEILKLLMVKETPIAILDTHAGIAIYDINSEKALRTQEADLGIKKILRSNSEVFSELKLIIDNLNMGALNLYPGSLWIANYFLRQNDKLYGCELHTEDYETLSTNSKLYKINSKLYNQNGYALMKSILPFTACKRGLVFIDPPFEKTTETNDLLLSLREALKRMPTATYVIWYPIKDKYNKFINSLEEIVKQNNRSLLDIKLQFYDTHTSLLGNGMAIINPPFKIEEKLTPILKELKLCKIGEGLINPIIVT